MCRVRFIFMVLAILVLAENGIASTNSTNMKIRVSRLKAINISLSQANQVGKVIRQEIDKVECEKKYVIEGLVRRADKIFMITLQLIERDTGKLVKQDTRNNRDSFDDFLDKAVRKCAREVLEKAE